MSNKRVHTIPLAMIGLASGIAAAKLAYDGKGGYGYFLLVSLVVAAWVRDLLRGS